MLGQLGKTLRADPAIRLRSFTFSLLAVSPFWDVRQGRWRLNQEAVCGHEPSSQLQFKREFVSTDEEEILGKN